MHDTVPIWQKNGPRQDVSADYQATIADRINLCIIKIYVLTRDLNSSAPYNDPFTPF